MGRFREQLCGLSVFCFVVILLMGQALGSANARDARLEEIRRYIEENGYSWVAGHTPVSDLPADEFQKLLGIKVPEDYERILREIRSKPPSYPLLDLPSRFDWTDSGGASPVRQQLCGDCWAHCAVASMESKIRIFDDDTTQISVQQAVDCNWGESGCIGGWMTEAYDIYKALGPMSEVCYPYQGVEGDCGADTCDFITRINDYSYIDTSVVSIKTHLMTNGPIAVVMHCYDDFDSYTGGCYEHEGDLATNHGVLILGWDDAMCDSAGAWHIKNSWGTWWGEAGFGWMKYGTCKIGYGATIIDYTPRPDAILVYDSYTIDDSSGDNDGNADPGETVSLPVTIENIHVQTATNVSGTITSSTPGITIVNGAATFPNVAPGATQETNPPHFSAAVDTAAECGLRAHFLLSMTCDQGVFTGRFDMLIGGAEILFFDDVEADSGWSLAAPDDDATGGVWRKRDPIGTFANGALVQPEIDQTPGIGIRCFVTSNRPRDYPIDAADVDDGKTTLTTPVFDLSEYETAGIKYWRWYSNDAGGNVDDVFTVDVTNDSGDSWVNLETVIASEAEWTDMDFDLGDYISLTDEVRVRLVASDYDLPSIVEAGIDDFTLSGCEKDYSSVEDRFANEVPEEAELYGSERNPFAGSTHIFFGVPHRMKVRIGVYDVQGRLTRELFNRSIGEGYHSAVWNGRSRSGSMASPGVYFIRLEAEGRARTAKVVLSG